MSKAEEIYEEVIVNNSCGQQRSEAYKRGVLDMLEFMEAWCPHNGLYCPYPICSAEADAWYAGRDEGYARWKDKE